MEITIDKAKAMLNEITEQERKSYPTYLDHCFAVGDMAGVVAKQLNLDVEKAIVMGYLHDIGKIHSTGKCHEIDGYLYLKNLGVDEQIASACMTHSFLNGDMYLHAGGIVKNKFIKKYLSNFEYTIYNKLINLSDLMNTNQLLTPEQRLIDIIERKGAYKNTQIHVIETKKLKKYFDDLCGQDIYEMVKSRLKDNK